MTIKSVYFALAWRANNRFGRRRLGYDTKDANTSSLIPLSEAFLPWPSGRCRWKHTERGQSELCSLPEDSQLTLPAENVQARHQDKEGGLVRCVLGSCCSDGPETKPDLGNFSDPRATYVQYSRQMGENRKKRESH